MSELAKAYTEVYSILNYVDEYYVNKISSKFLEYIYNKKDNDYKPNIDMTIPLEEQNLLEDTVNMLAIIKYNYWCENSEEKQELVDILHKNEEKYQEELHEKYKIEDVFKNPEKTELIVYKEPFFKKIVNKVKSFFKKS